MQTIRFPYHTKLTEYFRRQKKTWDWFLQKEIQRGQLDEYKKELLKNTYRLSRDSEALVYKNVDIAKRVLNIDKEVTVYQELNSIDINARVIVLEDEVNIIFSGNLLSILSEKEQLAVIAHELTHVLFLNLENGDFETTNRIINAISTDPNSEAHMVETARLYQLYIELFCDRGSFKVVEDLDVVVEALVKVSTGLKTVSAANYLKQAHEIFDNEDHGTRRLTHPETFIRSRALEIFQNKEDEGLIDKMIDAHWGMNRLDVFKQERLYQLSKKMLQLMTKPKWARTEAVEVLCKSYFTDFQYSDVIVVDEEIRSFFRETDDTIKEYISYMLLDFVHCDSSLEKAPLGHSFQIAEALDFDKTFKQILKKEQKITVKQLNELVKKGVAEVSDLSESEEESILTDQ